MRRWHQRYAAGALGIMLAGCSFLGPRPADVSDLVIDPDLGARPVGPIVEIARGTAGEADWAVAAFIAESGNLCMVDVVNGSMSGSACGRPIRSMSSGRSRPCRSSPMTASSSMP